MRRAILHIDFNSYFASVKQQKDPKLRGKPVGVIKAEGRTVIIAASAEAKRRGVRTGTLVWQAKRLCPEIILAPSRDLPLPKSVSRTYTLFREIDNPDEILAVIRNLVEEAAEKLRRARMAGRQFGLMIRGNESRRHFFDTLGLESSLFITRKHYTNDPLVVFNELKRLFITRKWLGSVRFLGVWIGLLAEESAIADCFLPEAEKRRLILAAQDEINGRFGHYTIFPASLLRTKIVMPEVNGYLGDERIRQRIEGIEG